MKKLIFLCILMLCLTACSKNKENSTDEHSKTVDLGETTQEENADDNKDEAKDDSKAQRKGRRAKNDDDKGDSKADAGNDKKADADEPAKSPKDTGRRGKRPGNDDKPGADNDSANKPEKADNANPDANAEAPAEGFDFSDEPAVDEKPAPAAQPAPARMPQPKSSLDIEKLINIRELREQTGYSGVLAESWLLGQSGDKYSAARLSTNKPSELGFSVQVWRPGNESAASKRFNDLFSQSFGGQKIKNVANDAFIANHHKINELGFFEKGRRAVVLLSCSDNICNQEQLKSIAQIIQRRL